MKLVEILARELKEWPYEAEEIAQDDCGSAHPYSAAGIFNGEEWTGDVQLSSYNVRMRELASDHATAIVTRADWQAAKDKLEGKTVKDENPWRRNRGRKTPPIDGLVDVKYRDGTIHEGNAADWWEWQHTNDDDDIMYWRAHTPPAKPATVKQSLSVDPVSPISGPLQWRDRITEIDAESKAENERHSAAMIALSTERAELVLKLASEGLAMIERKADPVEDMSDPAKWRKGDLLECVHCPSPRYTAGKLYSFLHLSVEYGSARTIDNDGVENGLMPYQFKWHSRPTN